MNNDYLNRAKKAIPDAQILSIVAAKRARQLALGGRPMIKCSDENYLDIALLEIAEGLLTYEIPGEAAPPVLVEPHIPEADELTAAKTDAAPVEVPADAK